MSKSATIELKQTCGACPEQYDAYIGDTKVAYLRLRHGYFSVEMPDAFDDLVYEAYPRGDGIFEFEERDHYLGEALLAIAKALIDKGMIK